MNTFEKCFKDESCQKMSKQNIVLNLFCEMILDIDKVLLAMAKRTKGPQRSRTWGGLWGSLRTIRCHWDNPKAVSLLYVSLKLADDKCWFYIGIIWSLLADRYKKRSARHARTTMHLKIDFHHFLWSQQYSYFQQTKLHNLTGLSFLQNLCTLWG